MLFINYYEIYYEISLRFILMVLPEKKILYNFGLPESFSVTFFVGEA